MIDGTLRTEVEAAVLAEVRRVGIGGLDKARIVARFMGRGAARATLYRAVERPLKSGRAGQRLAVIVKRSAARRARRTADPSADVARQASAMLPVALRPRDLAGNTTVSVIGHLHNCMETAEQVMAHARTDEGEVRDARLLLSASEHLRRSVETVAKLYQAIKHVQKLDAFHEAVVAEIADESPELAERVLARIARLCTRRLAV